MRLRFSDADRERLGITEEWVELDLDRLMFDEAVALEEESKDYDDVDEFLEDMRGKPMVRKGKPVMVDELDDDGNPVLDEDGKPKQVQKRSVPVKAMRVAAWMAARRSGSTVPLADFNADINGLAVGVAPQGKDDGPDPDSGS